MPGISTYLVNECHRFDWVLRLEEYDFDALEAHLDGYIPMSPNVPHLTSTLMG